ncbi:MAG: VOC family protein [Thermoplasmata archaeon]|nr:VOC family protein [Thermoplasmata archaeon]
MAKLELSSVGIFVKDLKAARAFYTRKVGLKVRDSDSKMGYLTLGATKGGEDASLNPWQPTPDWGAEMYESAKQRIGGVTGIGFLTTDLKRTVADLKKKGVKAAIDGDDETFGRFTDPDGNVFFLAQPAKPKIRRAGIAALAFVTVAAKDAKKSGEFFRKAFGMRARRDRSGEGEEDFVSYQFSPKATSITPFTPTKTMYQNPSDYDADMAHIGEETGIGFVTKDIYGLQEQLLAKGVRFQKKAEARSWGGIQAEFFDPDENVYSIMQYEA